MHVYNVSFMKKSILIFLLSAFISGLFMASKPLSKPIKIIQKMHKHWAGKWSKNMQFEQNVYLYRNDSLVREEVWQELLSSPKNLHIRFNGFETGNGVIFRNDSVYYFSGGKVARQEKRVHHLLLLAFDVYFLPPSQTEKQLQELGFNLDVSYEKEINGKKIIVVGTKEPSDTQTSQFWVEKENMYLTRVIHNAGGVVSDIELKSYQMIDNYPVATEISFKNNGKLRMVEKYFNISFPKNVNSDIFDIQKVASTKW
jgi:hypothetical protein